MIWQGTLSGGETKTLTAIVKSTRLGTFQIETNAGWLVINPPGLGDAKSLFVTVAEKGATVSDSIPQTNGFAWAIPDPKNLKTDAYTNHSKFNNSIPPFKAIDPSQVPSPFVSSNSTSNSVSSNTTSQTISSDSTVSKNSLQPLTLINPLTITGNWYVYISANVPPSQPGNADVTAPMVWGGIYIYDAVTNNLLGAVCTGMKDNGDAGHFSITIENPLNDGFYIQAIPNSTLAKVIQTNGNDYVYQPPYYWYPSIYSSSFDLGNFYTPSTEPMVGAWRIYETMTNDYYNRGAYYFLNNSNNGPHYAMPQVTAAYPDTSLLTSVVSQ